MRQLLRPVELLDGTRALVDFGVPPLSLVLEVDVVDFHKFDPFSKVQHNLILF
jgi:hypothetical protein